MLLYLSLIDTDDDKIRFEDLYNKYKQIMFHVSNEILKDNFLAEDAVHLAFIRVAKNMNKINTIDSSQTKSFMIIIVKRISIDLYRKRKKENNISFEEYHSNSSSEFSFETENDYDNIVLSAINKLPEIYKEVLILRFRHDFSTNEISKILNISKYNIEKRIQRAKKKLFTLLNNLEEI